MIRAIVALLALTLLAPATAAAAPQAKRRCPPPSELTRYEDGYVQVFSRRRNRTDSELLACRRGSDRRPFAVAFESDESTEVVGAGVEAVLGGRYLWTSETYSYAESPDSDEHKLFDLETRKSVKVTVGGDDGPADVAAIPDGLVTADGAEVVLHLGGEKTTLDTGQTFAPAYAGTTLYWLNGAGAKSRPVEALAPARARSGRRAPKRSRCLPRGRFTVLRDAGVVVSRTANGRYFACRSKNGRQRALRVPDGATAAGAPEDLAVVDGDRRVYYRRPVKTASGDATAIVVLDSKSGRLVRSAVVSGLTEAVPVTGGFAYTDGTSIVVVDDRGSREIVRTPGVTALAATDSDVQSYRRVLYWTDPSGPRGVDLDPGRPGSA